MMHSPGNKALAQSAADLLRALAAEVTTWADLGEDRIDSQKPDQRHREKWPDFARPRI